MAHNHNGTSNLFTFQKTDHGIHRLIKLFPSMFHLHCRNSAHLSTSVNQEENIVLPSNWVHKFISALLKALTSTVCSLWISMNHSCKSLTNQGTAKGRYVGCQIKKVESDSEELQNPDDLLRTCTMSYF